MSAQFILEYGGSPVRFTSTGAQLTTEALADRFCAEADAWTTAYANHLSPDHCRVVNLYLKHQAEDKSRLKP